VEKREEAPGSPASTAHKGIKGTTEYLPLDKMSLETLLIELMYLPPQLSTHK